MESSDEVKKVVKDTKTAELLARIAELKEKTKESNQKLDALKKASDELLHPEQKSEV